MNKPIFTRFSLAFILLSGIVFGVSSQNSTETKAQDSVNIFQFDFKKLKPIVQVFGTAAYDFENNTYGYSRSY